MSRSSHRAFAAALAMLGALGSAEAASAQASRCVLPARVPEAPAVTAEAPPRRMPIAGYTLALSWSPEFCRGRERDAEQRLQCGGANGRFGFIVHGLWPEGARSWPQWCRPVAPPSPGVVRAQLCRTPSVRLIAREWAKHGSCMSGSAASYFEVSNILADSLRYPAMERLSRDRTLTAGALRQAFARANPGRPAESFGLAVSRNGWLREVRVCHDRRFRPQRCPARLLGPRASASLKIWRGR